MKKLIALVLALVMALSLTTIAWGAGEVAKIGNTGYATLQAAVNAAVDGDTITLLSDIEYNSSNCGFTDPTGPWYNGVKYTGDKSFTIDLNGKTISDNGDINDYLLNFINKGAKANEITLKNGTIIGGANLWTVLSVGSSSATYPTTLNLGAGLTVTDNGAGSIGEVAVVKCRFGSVVNVLDGATVKTDTADYCVAGGTSSTDTTAVANIYSGATITMNNAAGIAVSGTANVNIYGGTITSAGWGVYTMTSGTPVFTISGGTITGAAGAVASAADVNNYPTADPSVTISGGDINGAVSKLVWGTPAGTAGGEVIVTGGIFTDDVSAYVADGKAAISTDGKFVIATKTTSGSGSETTLKDKDGYDIYAVDGTTSVKAADADITRKITGNAIASNGTVTYTATTYSDGANVYVEVDSSVADFKLMKGNTIVAYLVNLSSVGDIPTTTKTVSSYVKAVKDAKCGQYSETIYPAGVYMIGGKAYAADAGNSWALYNGKFVNYGGEATAVSHTYAVNTYNTTDRSVTTLKCSVCKQVFTVLTPAQVKTMAPSAYAQVTADGGTYFIAVASATAGTNGGTVNSADTFDAGIAMYVGMSVMAAAGSAVVLKKKD